ncbi:MAG: hypothetical protein H7329_16980 [Opitutaceae bacterium]|nr:hypothetical protein [Cytophagales bacterium]
MNKDLLKTSVITLLILMAVFSRLIPHPSNFTAIGAIAIFSGFLIPNRLLSLIIPIAAMFISDLVINNLIYVSSDFVWVSSGIIWIYLGIIAHSLSAIIFEKPTISRIAGASLLGAILFFILSNFGVWVGSGMYEKSISGIVLCYTAALPFFGNVLAGNLIFSVVLFGVYFILERKSQAFRTV